MNGEMYQICCIAAAVKKALKEKSAFSYTPQKYVNHTEFHFLPEKRFFITREPKACDVSAWYNDCLKKGLRDIKFLTPVAVKDRAFLGFSNTTQSLIVCFYKGDNVTFFTAQWAFDSVQKEWNVVYTEHEWKNAPSAIPRFENNTASFQSVLSAIKELAVKIDCNNFASVFQKALDILSGSAGFTDAEYHLPLPGIPASNMPLFEAASTADVFGAMGSWNDSPLYLAREKGMDKEYADLSDELLKQTRLAILFAINEW